MYTVTEDGQDIRLGAISEVAREIGMPTNQVSMWYHRRERNGFPEPHSFLKSKNGVLAAHFDIDAVRVWLLFYVPARGGYPSHRANR